MSVYHKAGVKGTPIVLLMSDNQIVKEDFLIYINDLLANGDIPDLCSQEEKDNFSSLVGVGDWLMFGLCLSLISFTGNLHMHILFRCEMKLKLPV